MNKNKNIFSQRRRNIHIKQSKMLSVRKLPRTKIPSLYENNHGRRYKMETRPEETRNKNDEKKKWITKIRYFQKIKTQEENRFIISYSEVDFLKHFKFALG